MYRYVPLRCVCLCRLQLTQLDSVTEWLVDIRSLSDSECMCVLQGKSLTSADSPSAEILFTPPKLISGQLHHQLTRCMNEYMCHSVRHDNTLTKLLCHFTLLSP